MIAPTLRRTALPILLAAGTALAQNNNGPGLLPPVTLPPGVAILEVTRWTSSNFQGPAQAKTAVITNATQLAMFFSSSPISFAQGQTPPLPNIPEVQAAFAKFAPDPVDFFTAVLKFVGIDPHPSPAALVKSTLVGSVRGRVETGVDVSAILTRRAPPHQDWSAEQRAAFVTICGPAMGRLGYEVPF